MSRVTVVLAVLLLGVMTRSVAAQTVQPRAGDQVRILALNGSEHRYEGVIVALHPDSVVLDRPGATRLAIPIASVHEVAIRRRSRRAEKAALYGGLGLVAGAFTGFLIGPLLKSDCASVDQRRGRPQDCVLHFFDERRIARDVMLFGGLGLGVGGVIGLIQGKPRWETLHAGPAALRLAAGPTPTIALQVGF